eukprot:jgi/Pico_ML_1/51871/g2694.t1
MVETGIERTASKEQDVKMTYFILLGLRIGQMVFALIAFAVMASIDKFGDSSDLAFLVAVGVILFALNIGWVVYMVLLMFAKIGQALEGYFTLAGFFYDIVMALLSFGSACAAAPPTAISSSPDYSKLAASAAMMFFASFLLMCSLGLVFYKEYSRKRL